LKINTPILLSAVTLATLLISCNSGNKVVSSFGKRKYTKGYFFNEGAHKRPVVAIVASNDVLENNAKAKGDKKTERTSLVQIATALPTHKAEPVKSSGIGSFFMKKINLLHLPLILTKSPVIATNANTESYKMCINNPPDDGIPGHGGLQASSGGDYDTDAIISLVMGLLLVGMIVISALGAISLVFDSGGTLTILLIPIIALIGLILGILGVKSKSNLAAAIVGIVLNSLILGLFLLVILAINAL
jgi:hypothetical protein